MTIRQIDRSLIAFFRRISVPFARLALFVIFFWFGTLKLIGLSPAGTLVHTLFDATLAGIISFGVFYTLFALFEMLIGILFLIKGAERAVMPLLLIHMVTTALPLFLLPSMTFTGTLVPTMEGQYIIKNLALIAAAIGIVSHLHPLKK
ncbi:MAG TPA: hypothetical protein VGE18_02060 [Candidatus Paceibacterota bacterium]